MLFKACAADESSYFPKICRSGSQEIPRLLRYPLSCRSTSPHVRNVRHMNPVHTLPLILFKIQRNLYIPIYDQVFQVFSSPDSLNPKLCMNACIGVQFHHCVEITFDIINSSLSAPNVCILSNI